MPGEVVYYCVTKTHVHWIVIVDSYEADSFSAIIDKDLVDSFYRSSDIKVTTAQFKVLERICV